MPAETHGKNLTHFEATKPFFGAVLFLFFFFLSRKLPPHSLRRGRRHPRVRSLLRRHEAANSLPTTLYPLLLSRLSLCPGSVSHRSQAHSIFITSRSHTSQSAGESLPHARPLSPGLQEGRDLGRGIYACIMPPLTRFLMCCCYRMRETPFYLPALLTLSLATSLCAVCSPEHTDINSEI